MASPLARYILVTSGRSCARITSLAECSAAAVDLGLSDTTASYDGESWSSDPPYCYYEGGSLKYNNNGTNTGSCSFGDQCLCKNGMYLPWLDILTYNVHLFVTLLNTTNVSKC